jgi:putative flippase GtrA
MNRKQHWYKSFYKYNIVALIATSLDFISFIFLNDILNLWYVFATIISVSMGGVTAFLLNRNWVFPDTNKPVTTQAIQYVTVWSGSLVLNTIGLYLMVENSALTEVVSKLIIAILVGVSYNFLMSKYYIFK